MARPHAATVLLVTCAQTQISRQLCAYLASIQPLICAAARRVPLVLHVRALSGQVPMRNTMRPQRARHRTRLPRQEAPNNACHVQLDSPARMLTVVDRIALGPAGTGSLLRLVQGLAQQRPRVGSLHLGRSPLSNAPQARSRPAAAQTRAPCVRLAPPAPPPPQVPGAAQERCLLKGPRTAQVALQAIDARPRPRQALRAARTATTQQQARLPAPNAQQALPVIRQL